MNHNDIRHKLSDYLDGAIPAKEKAEIEEHLKACEKCSDALAELRKTIEQVRQVEEVEPPAWMTQKIMASVRAEAEKKSIFHRLFYPLAVKLPIQAVAVLFMAVTAFYIYESVHPAMKFAEAPMEQAPAPAPTRPEPSTAGSEKDKFGKVGDSLHRSKQAPQSPGYRSLDMKLEYEKPSPPVPAESPTAAVSQSAKNEPSREERPAVPKSGIPSMMAEQAANVAAQAETKRVAPSAPDRTNAMTDKEISTESNKLERTVTERYGNGKPRTVITHKINIDGKRKIMEEHFDEGGKRHQIQQEFYDSGQLKARVEYDHGKMVWYMEFEEDGTKKLEKSKKEWLWLKYD